MVRTALATAEPVLRTAETTYEAPSSGKWAEACIRAEEARLRRTPVQFPTDTSDGVLPVFANHGRWIVQCPCGSAQLASESDKRFYCAECHNELAGGAWIVTHWPKQRDEIETLLGRRKLENQNWRTGEEVENLKTENLMNGLSIDGLD